MKKQLLAIAATLLAGSALLPTNIMAQKERSEIQDNYKWNVYDLYVDNATWDAKKAELEARSKQVANYKGRLGESSKTMLEFFELNSNFDRELSQLYIFASLLRDQDLRVSENIARIKTLEYMFAEMSQISAFVSPELASIPNETYDKYMAQEPKLAELYGNEINSIKRQKAHTLSQVEEELMAKVSMMGNVPSSAYDMFTDAEMPWPTVTISDGSQVELSQSEFQKLRASANRADRQLAFNEFWGTYKKFEGTFGELMNGNIKRHIFYAKAYKHNTALEAALYGNNIPTSVYHSLVENVNKNLPTFHRYLKLKQRMMGVDKLNYSDMYAPAVADVDLKFTYEEGMELVKEAVKPLGEEYGKVIERAFNERWIDVYPNKGKASGAYSNGGAYDVHPYILMNYTGQYDAVSTLIHELGHSMHSYFSNTYQPYPKSDYAIFVAEVASTFNEALLDDLMLKKITDKNEKISLLMNMLDGFKGTLFRQTQFAEFELKMHEMGEKGMPITGQALTELYADITRRYYGHDKGVCNINDVDCIEWAFIPHFYRQYYVYQYATSFVASQALAEVVLNGGEKERDMYIKKFLSAGSSKYPIDILKDTGIDMTTSEPFDNAMKRMNAIMDEIEKLLDEK